MLFNLDGSFRAIVKQFEAGKLRVTGINDYGNKMIIVIQSTNTSVKKEVVVVDTTSEPEKDVDEPVGEVQVPDKVTEKAETQRDKQGRVVKDDGTVLCRYCGRTCTSRGCTKHENNCVQNRKSTRYNG